MFLSWGLLPPDLNFPKILKHYSSPQNQEYFSGLRGFSFFPLHIPNCFDFWLPAGCWECFLRAVGVDIFFTIWDAFLKFCSDLIFMGICICIISFLSQIFLFFVTDHLHWDCLCILIFFLSFCFFTIFCLPLFCLCFFVFFLLFILFC